MKNKKEILLKEIVDYYTITKSNNGLPLYKINHNNESSEDLLSLLSEGLIVAISSNETVNPYVNNLNIITSLKTQKSYIKGDPGDLVVVLYPTPKALETVNYDYKKVYSSMVRKGDEKLKILFFEPKVLESYISNPNFLIMDIGYRGGVTISDEAVDAGQEFERVKNFGISYNDKNERAIGVFLYDLAELPYKTQMYWHKFELENQNGWVMNDNFIKNLILNEWAEEVWVYDSILNEIKAINKLSVNMGLTNLLREHERPRGYRSILFATLESYNSFIVTFDKMLSDSINKSFFKTSLEHIKTPELKNDEGFNKGTLSLLDEWLHLNFTISEEEVNLIIKPLKKVRKLRNKPAHSIEENKYNVAYYEKQNEVVKNVYIGLRELRVLLASHDSNENYKSLDDLDKYPVRIY